MSGRFDILRTHWVPIVTLQLLKKSDSLISLENLRHRFSYFCSESVQWISRKKMINEYSVIEDSPSSTVSFLHDFDLEAAFCLPCAVIQHTYAKVSIANVMSGVRGEHLTFEPIQSAVPGLGRETIIQM